MTYYSAVTLFTVFSMVIMCICVTISGSLTRYKKRIFLNLFILIAADAICEYFGFCLQEVKGTSFLHTLLKTVELASAPFIGVLIARLFSNTKINKLFTLFLMAHAFLEIISAFTGFIYKVDENSLYTHSSYYWIYTAAYLISLAYAFIIITSTMKNYQYSGILFLFTIILFILTGIIIQAFSSTVKTDWFTLAVASILLYLFNAEMIQQTDQLTSLINRRGYEIYLYGLREKAVIIFFDIDKFKQINDTYGHKQGDKCLKTVGAILKRTYARFGKCFRIGGDEFCVVVDKEINRINRLNDKFMIEIKKIRKANKTFPSVSIGYVEFDPENGNVADAVKQADELMYKYKQEHR